MRIGSLESCPNLRSCGVASTRVIDTSRYDCAGTRAVGVNDAIATINDDGSIYLPSRVIPIPTTISPQARRALASLVLTAPSWPPPHDKVLWQNLIVEFDRLMAKSLEGQPPFAGNIAKHPLAYASLYELIPANIAERNRGRAILYFHGGAFVVGGGALAASAARPLAEAMQCVVYSVDYRMPPKDPLPAAITTQSKRIVTSVATYSPESIGLVGSFAGGGIAASAILKLRDAGLPLPGAAVLLTPEMDLTESGDSFETNRDLDVVLKKRLTAPNALYANGHDLRDPYVSAVFGDFSAVIPDPTHNRDARSCFPLQYRPPASGLAPTGIATDLHVFEAMPHGGFAGAPEDAEALAEQIDFLDKRLVCVGITQASAVD